MELDSFVAIVFQDLIVVLSGAIESHYPLYTEI